MAPALQLLPRPKRPPLLAAAESPRIRGAVIDPRGICCTMDEFCTLQVDCCAEPAKDKYNLREIRFVPCPALQIRRIAAISPVV